MKVIYRNPAYNSKVKRQTVEVQVHQMPDEAEAGISEQKAEFTAGSEDEGSPESENCSNRPATSTNQSVLHVQELEAEESQKELEFTPSLNRLVLEYLELLGLENTCKTFQTECETKDIPMISSSITNQKFTLQDEIDTFLVNFDTGSTEKLGEAWENFFDGEDMRENPKLMQASFLLRIYIASLPFRNNADEESKRKALDALREFHQTHSAELTQDPVCLPLFAFPFVAIPDLRQAFAPIFTDTWKQDLRKKLKGLLQEIPESNSSSSVTTSDLKAIFRFFLDEYDYVQYRQSTSYDNDGFSSETEIGSRGDASGRSLPRQDVCSYVKRSLRQTQERYCKLLNATTAVVSALEDAVQGRTQDVRSLESKLQTSFPELFDPKTSQQSIAMPDTRVLVEEQVSRRQSGLEPTVEQGDVTDISQNVTLHEANCSNLMAANHVINTEDDEWTEDEYSDVDTEVAEASDASSPDKCKPSELVIAGTISNIKTCDDDRPRNLSARPFDQKIKICHNAGRKTRSEVTLLSNDAESVVGLNFIKPKDNMPDFEDAEEVAKVEGPEIEEIGCQDLLQISPPKSAESVERNSSGSSSILPPTLSSRFPTPPRTYVVPSTSNLKLMFIPSSMEFECSSATNKDENDENKESPRSSSELKGQRLSTLQTPPRKSPSRSPRSPAIEYCEEITPRESRKRWEPDQSRISKHLLPQHVTQDTQLLGTRMLTPPPEKKSTAMASIMGVLSNPPSPMSNSSSHEQRKAQITSFKRIECILSENGKQSLARALPAVGTGPAYARKIQPGSTRGHAKKYSSRKGYHGQVYRMNHKSES